MVEVLERLCGGSLELLGRFWEVWERGTVKRDASFIRCSGLERRREL